MKKLILIRHSDAEIGSINTSDFNRKLTTKGIQKVNFQANRLIAMNLNIDLIITSTAIRALETTQIISTLLNPNCPIQEVPFLYEDFTTSHFFKFIGTIHNTNESVILVGHNPNLSVMASRLDLGSKISFAPCSIGIFMVGDNWCDVEVGCGKMIDFIM